MTHPEDELLAIGFTKQSEGRYLGRDERGRRYKLEVDRVNRGSDYEHEEPEWMVEAVSNAEPGGRTSQPVVKRASSKRAALREAAKYAKRRKGLPSDLDFS